MSIGDIFAYLRTTFSSVHEFNEHTSHLIQQHLPSRSSRFPLDIPDYCLYIKRSKNANIVVYQAQVNNKNSKKETVNDSGQSKCSEPNNGKEDVKQSTTVQNSKSEVETYNERKFHASDALHPFWIKMEPEHVERRRQRGEEDDYCELKFIEKKLAYGCSSDQISFSDFCHMFFSTPTYAEKKNEKRTKRGHISYTAEEEEKAKEWWSSLNPQQVKFVAASALPIVLILSRDPNPEHASPPVALLLTILKGSTVCILDHLYISSIEPKHFYELPKVEYVDFFAYALGCRVPQMCEETHTEGGEEQQLMDAPTSHQERVVPSAGMLIEERRTGQR